MNTRFLRQVALTVTTLFTWASAQTTWDGGGANNNWNTGLNWNTDSVPAIGDSVVFDAAGLLVRQPTLSATGGITGITLNASPIFTLTNFNADFTVTGPVSGVGGFSATSTATSNFGRFVFTNTTSSFDGDVTIQGTAIVRYNPGATINSTFGDGDIVIDGGTFSLQGTAQANSTTTGMPTGNGGTDRNLMNTIVVTSTGGTLNMNQGSANSGFGLSFNHIELGGALSTSSTGGGNAGGYTIAGTVTLLQDVSRTLRLSNNTSHNGSDWIAGQITDGAGVAGNALRIAISGRGLQISNAGNNYTGGTIIEAAGSGGHRLDITATGTLGTGNLTVESGGRIRLLNPTALATGGNLASGSTITLNAGGAVGVATNTDISDRFTSTSAGIYGIESVNHTYDLNMSTLGNGRMFLGSIIGGTYAGATLTSGLDNTYRLGGGNSSTVLANLVLNQENVLKGNNNLIVGSGLNTNASYGRTILAANQDFAGDIVINTDGLLATKQNGGTPFGNTSNRITVYGTLAATGANGVFNNAIAGNIEFKPGSMLLFNNLPDFANGSGGNNADRWANTSGITLRGSALQLFGARSADSEETVGTINFHENSQIQTRRNSTSGQDVALTLAAISRQGRAVLGVNPGTAANLGGDASNSTERFVVVDTSGLAINNGMVAPWAIDSAGNNFLRYDASSGVTVAGTRGLAAVVYTSTDPNTAGATDIVNRAGALSLTTNPTVYALRYNDTINTSVGNDTITVASGGILAVGNNKTNNAILDSGSAELIFWAVGGTQNFSNNAALKTSGGFTKAGGSTMNLTNTSASAIYDITGGIVIQNGTVVSGSRFALALDDNLLTVNHDGRLSLNDVATTVLGLSGTGSGGNVFNSGANVRDLTLALASGTQTYEGKLSNNINVVKIGGGTQVFGAPSVASYLGTTSVNEGTLLIHGDFSGALGAVTVSGGTLGGTGTLGGNTTIQSGGTLAPGASPGLMTYLGSLTLEGNTEMELDGLTRETEYDAVDVGTTLTYGGTMSAVVGFSIASDATFNLFDFTTQSGTFTTIGIGGSYTASLNSGNSYTANDGVGNTWSFDHDTGVLAFTAIPEPGTLLLLGVGGLLLGMRLRRRH